ncbi:hypothetical protein K1719_033279 [Acacia pycnantha]|nr:hypothetical protein K1719_033279 [Acacia pycnantha]
MCQEINKTFFYDVNDTKDTWSILAKVLRKWSVKRKVAPYAVWKVGMLLADEKGSRIEVSATHKNLIGKLTNEPREGMVYNFQNFQVLENDDKYRITTETFGKKHEDMEPPITVLVRVHDMNQLPPQVIFAQYHKKMSSKMVIVTTDNTT